MKWLGSLFRTYGPRAIGSLAGWGAAKIAEKTGIVVDPATLVGVGVAVYSAVHRVTSAQVNPGDAAKGRLAEAEKVASDTGRLVAPAPPSP